MEFLEKIIKIIIKLIDLFAPAVMTKEKAAERKKLGPYKALMRLAKRKKFELGDFHLCLFQDNSNPDTYNDWLVIKDGKKLYRWLCTGEAGDWEGIEHKFKWFSRWKEGNYIDVFKIGTFLKAPAYKMRRQVDLIDIKTNQVRRGGGCHIHIRRSKRERVRNSSAGCIVPFFGTAVYDMVKLGKLSKLKFFSCAVFMLKDFPEIEQIEEYFEKGNVIL